MPAGPARRHPRLLALLDVFVSPRAGAVFLYAELPKVLNFPAMHLLNQSGFCSSRNRLSRHPGRRRRGTPISSLLVLTRFR